MSTKAYDCYAVPTSRLGELILYLDAAGRQVYIDRLQKVTDHVVESLATAWRYDGPAYDGDPADKDAAMRHLIRHSDERTRIDRTEITAKEWWDTVEYVTGGAHLTKRRKRFLLPRPGQRIGAWDVADLVGFAQQHFSSGEVVDRSPFTDATLRVDLFRTARTDVILLRPVAEAFDWEVLLGTDQARALGVVPWEYWNNADEDPDVPEEEWAQRGRDWDASEPMGLSWSARADYLSILLSDGRLNVAKDRLPVFIDDDAVS